MSNEHKPRKKTVPKILACRPGELKPVIQHWMDRYPELDTTFLLKRGLRLALRDVAGKRFAHLVDA